MPDCLIISADAQTLLSKVVRLAETPMAIKAAASVEEACGIYEGETVLFGEPAMIAEVLSEMPNVKWVQSSWAGVTPLIALTRRDYVLTGIKGVFGTQISEYVFGYLLAFELKLQQRLDAQRNKTWFESVSGTLQGKRLGIMGTGTIGRHLAATANTFGVRVTGLSLSGASSPGFEQVMRTAQLDEFLSGLDYLVSTLPQTPQTDKLLSATSLVKLPVHAYFINVGRSNVIDDDALIAALKNGRLAGATLDVFDEEPIPVDSPLWQTPNLLITAHIAAMSDPSLIVPIFVENYRRYTANQSLQYVIDFGAGY